MYLPLHVLTLWVNVWVMGNCVGSGWVMDGYWVVSGCVIGSKWVVRSGWVLGEVMQLSTMPNRMHYECSPMKCSQVILLIAM